MAKFSVHNFLPLAFLLALNRATSDPILSCSQTPHPQVCSSMIAPVDNQFVQLKSRVSFRDVFLRATMDRAIHVHRLASSSDLNSLDAPQKGAWDDCLVSYGDIIDHLNLSMLAPAANSDTQTWLSAAATNQETCRDGFSEIDSLPRFQSSPFYGNSIPESIDNMLAIDKSMAAAVTRARRNGSDEFPPWLSVSDQKLIRCDPRKKANLTVAQDGSGDYTTIAAAVGAAEKIRGNNTSRYVIHVKSGVYKDENILIPSSMVNLMLVGDGINETIITGSKSVKSQLRTIHTASFTVRGWGFMARDMAFENTAGPENFQAVALRSVSDRSVFYRCCFLGYQDTLYVHSERQFYSHCNIHGTIDFIFGDAAAIFHRCNIYARKPLKDQTNVITCQSRGSAESESGIVILDSAIMPDPDLLPGQGLFKTYLGRPWRKYSRTVVMRTDIGGLIDPEGWSQMEEGAEGTLYYGEYGNQGPGANVSGRVKWPGYHVLSESEAEQFTIRNFFRQDANWTPAAGAPFTSVS